MNMNINTIFDSGVTTSPICMTDYQPEPVQIFIMESFLT